MAVTSYAIWNNKGGVGKSTIAFHIASRYAELNPLKNVVVIDLCPQANSSMMLLGGGMQGEQHVAALGTLQLPKTVVGYLSSVITNGTGAQLPDPLQFLLPVKNVNPAMPENLALLCGDGNLEPMAPAISQQANNMPLVQAFHPWVWIHSIFRAFISSIAQRLPERDLVVFIDTNPSFSIYTELAVSAADRLIVPVNADDSSRIAANALFSLLYGQIPPHPVYGRWTFASNAQAHGLPIPKIHTIIGNRLTQYGGPAGAFSALSDATADALFNEYRINPQYFTPRQVAAGNVQHFRQLYSVALRDFNTAGVVAAHLGRPLSQLPGGHYLVYNSQIQVNADRVAECQRAVDQITVML